MKILTYILLSVVIALGGRVWLLEKRLDRIGLTLSTTEEKLSKCELERSVCIDEKEMEKELCIWRNSMYESKEELKYNIKDILRIGENKTKDDGGDIKREVIYETKIQENTQECSPERPTNSWNSDINRMLNEWYDSNRVSRDTM